MSPSFSQLERFVATARKGSYSAAAEDLFVTPQAVSKSIHDLESKLHVQLLEARGKQLKPTDAGGRVYRYAVDALDARGGIRDVTPAGEGGVAQLRGSLSVVAANIPLRGRVFREEDFEPFRRAYPLVELQVSFFAGSGCPRVMSWRRRSAWRFPTCMVGSWPCRMISVATKRWWSGGLRKRACVRAMLRLR